MIPPQLERTVPMNPAGRTWSAEINRGEKIVAIIEIKNRWNGKVLYSGEHESLKEAVKENSDIDGLFDNLDLSEADLVGADLSNTVLPNASLAGADLSNANLSDANLARANLSDADLSDAGLSDADLSGVDLSTANLPGADLSDADLTRANLTGANLVSVNLAGANLAGANLADANLAGAKVGFGSDQAHLVGTRPIVQLGPIGPRNAWLIVFWCADAGVRISNGVWEQITEQKFIELLSDTHLTNFHAQHYLEALSFAKRILKDQEKDQEEDWSEEDLTIESLEDLTIESLEE
jgi:uncharacterized protein YjbI with pentapeptide repeats